MKKLILLSMLSVLCTCANAQLLSVFEKPLMIAEKMPSFPDGDSLMWKFIDERIFYPWAGDSIKGRVIVRFVVHPSGDINDAKILRGINPIADSIAVSIVRQMPRWIPGEQNGKIVPVYFTLPITFNPAKIPSEKKPSFNCTMARFPNGNKAMYEFIAENLEYYYSENGVSGKIVVKFIVDVNGKVWHPFIWQSLDPALDAEVLRVVSLMPDWIVPKTNTGCYLFTLPIVLRLE